MTSTCPHNLTRSTTHSCPISEPLKFWNKYRKRIVNRCSVPCCPDSKFHTKLTTDVDNTNWAYIDILADDEFAEANFEFFIWAQRGGKALYHSERGYQAAKDTPVKCNERLKFCHGYKPFDLYCKIVYKGECSLCEVERKNEEKTRSLIREALQEARSENHNSKSELNGKVDILIAQLATLKDNFVQSEIKAYKTAFKMQKMEEENRELSEQIANLSIEQSNLIAKTKHDQTADITSAVMWELRRDCKLTDFVLIVDDRSIPMHKNVLASKSKFFADQFEENPQKKEYSIGGTNFEVVNSMVEYVYLGKAEKFDEHLYELYKLANRFAIAELKEKCIAEMQSKLTMESAPHFLIISISQKDDQLSGIVIEFAEQNGGKEKLVLSSAFLKLFEENVGMYGEVMKALRR
ncbi:BTB/POZ domain protein [Aphelenchoides besseyi]|nr:BTB/POZ domain protein [Aphelenchoides besseyi]